MPHLAISARFPLGTFLGHQATGQAAAGPDTARLHAALIHSAGKGTWAVEQDGDLRPALSSLAALRWLEANPPAVLGLPQVEPVSSRGRGAASAFRDDGVMEKSGGSLRSRKAPKRQSDAMAVNGTFWWGWDEEVDEQVFTTIQRLCEDVSCLGEADSPVLLEAHDASLVDFEVTHKMSTRQAALPEPGGLSVRSPMSGRTDALESDYVCARPKRRPTSAQDKPTESQRAESFKPTADGLRVLDYRPLAPITEWAPWAAGIALHLDRPIATHESVRFCAALHRTLSKLLGHESLPLLTGTYPDGAPRPANRVAIHYTADPRTSLSLSDHGALLVLLPADADAAEAAMIQRVVRAVSRIYLGSLGERSVTDIETFDATMFWPELADGTVRFWRPTVAAVPEINRPRGLTEWSLDDTAMLSLGHVLRDQVESTPGPDGDVRRGRVQAVRGAGAWAGRSRRVADSRIERYVHKAPKSLVVQPYTTTVSTNHLIPDRAAWALGQSRHLGGGFMVPFDLPPDVATDLLGWTPC